MTITLNAETEARLREKAEREGRDVSSVADALIVTALEWEAREQAEALAGVRQGDHAVAEGRERPLAVFLEEQRVKHGLSPEWPNDAEAGDESEG